MKKYFLEVIVFISGAVVMILELSGSRIMAPYLGNSLPVWTAIIGVILGSLSLGYFLGGRMADRKADLLILAKLLFVAGLFIGVLAFVDEIVLVLIRLLTDNLRINILISSIILLAPSSVVLGMISPYAIRLHIKNVETSGSAVGTLYALSTLGSIAGTFLAGFFLISYFGTFKIIIFLALTMFLVSFLSDSKKYLPVRISLILFLCLILGGFFNPKISDNKNGFIDIDTDYSRVWIVDDHEVSSGQLTRSLIVNGEYDSSVFLSNDDLVYEYTKRYRLVKYFRPNTAHALMIGGGAYTYPKDYLKMFPEAMIDVVEIDPKITDIAGKYFNFKEYPRMTIFHDDGRIFLNNTDEQYDVIFLDAYKSFSVPFHLTTKEAVNKMHQNLDERGIVLANIISSVTGDTGKFLRAEYATFKSEFPYVYIFLTKSDESEVQNIILVAAKSVSTSGFQSQDKELQSYLDNLWDGPITGYADSNGRFCSR